MKRNPYNEVGWTPLLVIDSLRPVDGYVSHAYNVRDQEKGWRLLEELKRTLPEHLPREQTLDSESRRR